MKCCVFPLLFDPAVEDLPDSLPAQSSLKGIRYCSVGCSPNDHFGNAVFQAMGDIISNRGKVDIRRKDVTAIRVEAAVFVEVVEERNDLEILRPGEHIGILTGKAILHLE